MSSPSERSTLTTRAPASASINVASGLSAARPWARDRGVAQCPFGSPIGPALEQAGGALVQAAEVGQRRLEGFP